MHREGKGCTVGVGSAPCAALKKTAAAVAKIERRSQTVPMHLGKQHGYILAHWAASERSTVRLTCNRQSQAA